MYKPITMEFRTAFTRVFSFFTRHVRRRPWGRGWSRSRGNDHVVSAFSYPEPFLRAVNRARRGALAKSKPDTIKTWYPVKHCACSTSNADKHFGFLVCFVLKVFLQENPTKAVGFANFIYLNQLVGKT